MCGMLNWMMVTRTNLSFCRVLKHGFHITRPGQVFSPVECENYKSATCPENRPKVEQQLAQELNTGRYFCVEHQPPIVSSLGAVPKSDPTQIRLIHDCSRPLGKGLNSYASVEKCSYDTVDLATKLLPQGGFMAKIDLAKAYRSVPVHPDSYGATGLKWTFPGSQRPSYFVDTRLPFGASMSPGIFQTITASVTRIMQRYGFVVLVYLDDFLVIGETLEKCSTGFHTLVNLLQRLGFDINWDKVVYPCQRLIFLGVEIDSITQTLSLPEDKLNKLRSELVTWTSKKRATKRELEQLVGRLNWASRVITGGRTFLRRLIDLMCTLRCKHHHLRLTGPARADIAWWSACCSAFNGTAHFFAKEPVPDYIFTSDACLEGGAALFNRDWFYANWHTDFPELTDEHINVKEFFTVILAARRWATTWRNLRVVVYTDNQVTMAWINKGTCHNKLAMSWLRELFWLSVVHNFHLSAKYIPGCRNIASDALSRLHDSQFRRDLLSLVPIPVAGYCAGIPVVNFYGHVTYDCFMYLQESVT